ncbi:MAG TPA: hypothetical protein PLZ91_04170 [Bacteroidia bacterium]|nr:hypothetical protein [Bacteroidota bacterium]HQV99495.1 hypothetical protein [Bacteroidia bacterium]
MQRPYDFSYKIIFLFCTLFGGEVNAQNVAAYPDNRGNLQVFDGGLFRELEYLPVRNYKYAGNSVAYIDNKNDFRIYSNGSTITMLNAADFSYNVTDYLISFKVGQVLYAFDKGEKRTLCYYNSMYAVNDSILAFFDDSRNVFSAYYDGKVVDMEDSFLDKPKSIKTGPNLVAWVNQSNYFNVFYHGELYQLDNIAPLAYSAGRDIVAYVDDYVQQFRLFYKGDTATAELFPPDSFKVGFANMAYVDNLGNFKIFENGASVEILPDRPKFFEVKGNTIVYGYNNTFNVYYDGKTTQLQTWVPNSYKMGNDGVAWIGDNGVLMLFHKGKTYTVSYEIVNNYYVNGNVLKYEVGNNTTTIFYNGKNY